MMTLQFKDMHHMNYKELYDTFHQLNTEGVSLAKAMFDGIVKTLHIDPAPELYLYVGEVDTPNPYGYMPTYTTVDFIFPNAIIINLANLYCKSYENACKIGLNDMRKAFTGELAHGILLALTKMQFNFYANISMLAAYDYYVENYVWYTMYPMVENMLKKKYYVKFQEHVFDTISGKAYSYQPAGLDQYSRVFLALAQLTCQEPWEVSSTMDLYRYAPRFILNLTVNGINYPGIMLTDKGRYLDTEFAKAEEILNEAVPTCFDFSFRCNFYGRDNTDITLSINLNRGEYYPFIAIPESK